MNRRLERLIDEVLGFLWSAYPTLATAAGIHEHDHRLTDYDPGAIATREKALSGYLRDLHGLRESSPPLSADEDLDARVLAGALTVEARLLADVRLAFRDPATYLDDIFYGTYYLVQRDFAPLAERASLAARRIAEVPRLVRQAEANLSDLSEIPRAWVESASRQIAGSLGFLADLERALVPQAGAAAADLGKALAGGRRAIEEFDSHLRRRLRDCSGEFAIGRGLFDFLLREQHGLALDADDLHALAQDLLARTQARLAEAAGTIDPTRSWQALVAEWKSDHPARQELLSDYRKEVDRARAFVVEKRLASLPPGERLHVVETPPFQRTVTPFAAYLSAGPFEDNQDGYLWVTPPEEGAPPEVSDKVLQDHLRPAIPGTAVHETYPGHHLQLSVANRIASKVRRQFCTPVLVEGWAFYCEQMMGEEGFYVDRRSRVLQLKDQLWRSLRILIDVGLQTRGMEVEEAARLLQEIACLEAPTARGEAYRYTRTATQPMSYAVGKEEILRLRDVYRKQRGAGYTAQEFHDRLLSFGSIPISLIAERIVGQTATGGAR
jgi:hypothetical protein